MFPWRNQSWVQQISSYPIHACTLLPCSSFNQKSQGKQFTGQGVEKNSDDAKRIFFQKSIKWDAAKDALQLEVQQQALHHCEREKRKYDKQNNEHWDSGIVESRKKRMYSRDGASAGEPESEASVVNSAEVPTTNYEKNDSQTICARNQITKFASEWKIKIKDRRTDRGFKEQ